MKKYTLRIAKRAIVGKKIKKLRREGILPANIYGKSIASVTAQVPLKDFEQIYKEAKETGLVELDLDGEKRPVLIHNVQSDPLTNLPLHADFYQVNLKEKVKTMVPIILIGEPLAVTEKLGLLLQTLNEVEVEALPSDLPEKIEADVSHLAAVGDQVTVSDIKQLPDVTILTESSQIIAKISELVSKEAEEQAKEEAAKAEEAKAEETKVEEGEEKPKPAEEEKKEEQPQEKKTTEEK